jgi:hypothetical protein
VSTGCDKASSLDVCPQAVAKQIIFSVSASFDKAQQ